MIFRHRRAIAWSALVLVAVAAVFALPVFGELGNENDFDDPCAEAVAARNAVNARDGRVRRAEHRRAGAAGRGRRQRRARRRGSRGWRGGAARSGRGVGGRLRARRRPPAGLARRALDLPAGDVQERPGAGRGRGSRPRSRDVPVGDAGRRRDRRARGRRPGLGGHRARRADRVPDPLPADAARVPQRGLGAAAAGGRRLDDPADLPRHPGDQHTRSTRCRSTP